MMETLSDKIVDNEFVMAYDVKEFIKQLKEEFAGIPSNVIVDVKGFLKVLDNRAGDKLI